MKNLKLWLAGVAMLAAIIPASAGIGGETEENALMSKANLSNEIFDRVHDIKGEYFNLKDATVELSFFVNPKGDIAIEEVTGESNLANMAVVRKLQSQKMYVAPELQNTRHHISIRYIAD